MSNLTFKSLLEQTEATLSAAIHEYNRDSQLEAASDAQIRSGSIGDSSNKSAVQRLSGTVETSVPVVAEQRSVLNQLSLLKQAGILQSDVTLEKLADAAGKLQGVDGASKVSWELVGPNFALRGIPTGLQEQNSSMVHEAASIPARPGTSTRVVAEQNSVLNQLSLLKQAGILQSDVTLEKLADAAGKLQGVDGASKVSWELVGPNFALRGIPTGLQEQNSMVNKVT